jgi:hypothetical protein
VSKVLARLAEALAERRTPDGGFAAVAGGPADSESTALAALVERAIGTGVARDAARWLVERQRGDGAWPFTDAVPEPSWAGAWALLALGAAGADPPALARGGAWLVAREGVRPSRLARALGALTGQRRRIEHDLSLRGWPWHAAAASWTEPTASALLALQRMAPSVAVPGARERIEEGRRLLRDRMCPAGGWNYGNRRVLGEAVPPYPDTTALVLIALQRDADRARLDASFGALERLLEQRASSLALALGALAFELHARDAAPLRARLAARVDAAGPPAETRAVAFALLALAGGAKLLEVPA